MLGAVVSLPEVSYVSPLATFLVENHSSVHLNSTMSLSEDLTKEKRADDG